MEGIERRVPPAPTVSLQGSMGTVLKYELPA